MANRQRLAGHRLRDDIRNRRWCMDRRHKPAETGFLKCLVTPGEISHADDLAVPDFDHLEESLGIRREEGWQLIQVWDQDELVATADELGHPYRTPASRASRMVFMTSSRVWQLPSSSHARHSTSGSSISRKTLRSPRSTRASYASRKRSLFALDIRTFSRSPFPGSNRAGSRWTFTSTGCVAERGRLSQGKEVGDR